MLLSLLSFPSFPMGRLLFETVSADVGMIGNVVACVGSERASVVLLVARATSKTGSSRAIIA